jgi:hypothetical protein
MDADVQIARQMRLKKVEEDGSLEFTSGGLEEAYYSRWNRMGMAYQGGK